MYTDKPLNIKSKSTLIAAMVLIVGVVLISTLLVTARLGDMMVRRHAPMVDASMEIRLNLSMFHLWLEEYLLGDPDAVEEDFWVQLDEAEWFAMAMLQGGKRPNNIYIPLDSPQLREEVNHVLTDMESLKQLTVRRIRSVRGPVDGEDMVTDEEFDRVFLSVLDEAGHIESVLQGLIAEEQANYRILSAGLVGFGIALSIIVGASCWVMSKGASGTSRR